MTTFGYIRVSTTGQADGDGPRRQCEAIEARATRAGALVDAAFLDLGVSGMAPLAERPGLHAALRTLRAGDVLIVERADRLSRDVVEAELALRQFRAAGVRVVEAEGGHDLTVEGDNPTAELVRRVLSAVGAYERAALLAKLRAARRRVTAQCGGVPAFGALPGEAEALGKLREVARRRCSVTRRRWSAGRVAAELNRAGVPSRSGKPWSRSTVRKLLSRGAT